MFVQLWGIGCGLFVMRRGIPEVRLRVRSEGFKLMPITGVL